MATVEQELQAALAQHQAGELARAEAAYRRLVRRAPRDSDIPYLLGSLYVQQHEYRQALPLLEQAAAVDPTQARYHNSLGVALKELGRIDAALAANERALALQPEYAQAMNNRGVLARERGELKEAIAWYERSIAADPADPQAFNNLGIAIKEDVIHNLEVDEFNYEDYGKLDRAEHCFHEAVRLDPEFAAAHNNLGAVLRLQRRYEEAILHVERALALEPDSEEAQSNWGLLLYLLGFYDRAEVQLLRLLDLYPASKGILCGLADCCRMQGRYEEAIAYFDRFLAEEPDDIEAQYARGQMLLQMGRMDEGWAGYEWRLRRPHSPQRVYAQPAWDGTPLDGRTLLVHAEQGFGDAFQFLRYLPLIDRGAGAGRVVFECQPGTRALLERCRGFDEIVERPASNRTEGRVPHDAQVPLMSLAALFPHPAEGPPGREPYIHPDPELVRSWGRQMAEAAAATGRAPSDLKVGIIWAGNPQHANDRNRSMRLADLAPLRHVPGVTLFSLQKGTAETQVQDAPAGMTLVVMGGALTDFSDTAAVLANLDLLISVDTSTAHLAGAMGVPVWLLTPFVPDWRWGLSRSDTPWYPSMRLFRQPRLRNWRSVMTQVLAELERLVVGSALRRIEQAETLFAAGRVPEAKAILLTLAQDPAPHPRALNNLAVLYWKEGATAETLRCFERALEAAPTDPTILENCAAVVQTLEQQKQRRHREARKDLRVLTPGEIEEMNAIQWWHRIPIGLTPDDEILYTPGHCLHAPDGTDYATTRFGLPTDMTGATVLDIGGWDGYFAFEAEKRGAAEITVADNFPQEGRLFGTPAGLAFATRILQSKVRFIAASVFDLPQVFPDRKFDYVFFFGVLYHIDDPLTSLKIVRNLIGDGVALIETARFEKDDGGEPLWALRHGFEGDSTNLWVPSINGLLAGCRYAGFEKTDIVCDITTRCTVRAVNAPQKTGKDQQ